MGKSIDVKREVSSTLGKFRRNISRRAGPVRQVEAELGLSISRELIAAGFVVNLSRSDLIEYNKAFEKIAEVFDGKLETIKGAVISYFQHQHTKMALPMHTFEIHFSPKRSGIQTGLICHVNSANTITKYFIKTHQYGPTTENGKSSHPPDAK